MEGGKSSQLSLLGKRFGAVEFVSNLCPRLSAAVRKAAQSDGPNGAVPLSEEQVYGVP